MNRRYALARLAATLEGLPELTSRLNQIGTAFEELRAAPGAEARAEAAAVFDRLYGDAAAMLAQAEERGQVPPNELIALEEALRRVEGALDTYRRLATGRAVPVARRASMTPLLLGAVLLGGVVFLSRTTRR